jgi:hypothetical protein
MPLSSFLKELSNGVSEILIKMFEESRCELVFNFFNRKAIKRKYR